MKNPTRSSLLSPLAFGLFCAFAVPDVRAQTIVYNFGTAVGTTAPTSDTIVDVSAGSVSAVNVGSSSTSTTNPSSGYAGASGDYNYAVSTTVAGALNISTSSYFQFTLTPAAGMEVELSFVQFGARIASGANTPTTYTIYTSVDSYAASVASGSFTKGTTWQLYAPTFTTVTGAINQAVTVRVYLTGSDGTTATGSVRIDDLTITAEAVPEPSIAAAFAFGGLGLLLARNRKRTLA